MPKGYAGRTERLCPACGEVLISGHQSRCTECRRIYMKKYLADPDHYNERLAKRRARQQAKRANWDDQPCEKCGAYPAERHHPDYSKPLEIVWLCKKHHDEVR